MRIQNGSNKELMPLDDEEILKMKTKIKVWETDRGYLVTDFDKKPDMQDIFNFAFGNTFLNKDGFDVQVTVTKGKIIIEEMVE